ncbi:MAG: hypothetical protein KAI43_09925 [Candidatus Aureabacteria bacterium]|nr:hypothetical protein [Candidatus Auribacterota bacterium]
MKNIILLCLSFTIIFYPNSVISDEKNDQDISNIKLTVEKYLSSWIAGDLKGIYDEFYTEKINFRKFKNNKKHIINNDIKPTKINKIFNPIIDKNYARIICLINVPESWGIYASRHSAMFNVVLNKNNLGDWKILYDQNITGKSKGKKIAAKFCNSLIKNDISSRVSLLKAKKPNTLKDKIEKTFPKGKLPIKLIKLDLEYSRRDTVLIKAKMSAAPNWINPQTNQRSDKVIMFITINYLSVDNLFDWYITNVDIK